MFHSASETNTKVGFQDQNKYAQGKKKQTKNPKGPIEGIPFYHYLS